MKLMYATLLIAAAVVSANPETQAALSDRAQLPRADWGFTYYVNTASVERGDQAQLGGVLAFVCASSSRQDIIERCTPEQVTPTLWRIDLRNMKWDWRQWWHVLNSYPYRTGKGAYRAGYPPPLVIRADWLCVALADTSQSDAYYRLLYGTPKLSRDDFLRVWGANKKVSTHFGVIVDSDSPIGPSVAGVRLVENFPTSNRGDVWRTRDSAEINAKSDPLEHLTGGFKHVAEELIAAMPKHSLRTGQRGRLQAYLLSDAKGNRQEEAPGKIVTDHLGFRGAATIRNWGSCIGCHTKGINNPGTSELRRLIAIPDGPEIYADRKSQEFIERFHLSDAGLQIKRDCEDYALGVAMCNGWDGETNAKHFRAAIDSYDAAVTLRQAAREAYLTPAEFRLALGWASSNGYPLPARLAALANNDEALPRAAWEDHWATAVVVAENWQKR